MDGRLRQSSGFTLMELLVALAVLATLSLSAVLVAGRPGDRASEGDRARFLAMLGGLEGQAVADGLPRGLSLDRRAAQGWVLRSEGWEEVGPAVAWQGGVVPSVPASATRGPDVILLPTGQRSAFRMRFDGTPDVICRVPDWGPVTCE